MADYIIFETPLYGPEENEPPFELRISRNSDYAVFKFGHGDASDLLFQIQHALTACVPLMEWADLGLTDPEDIPF